MTDHAETRIFSEIDRQLASLRAQGFEPSSIHLSEAAMKIFTAAAEPFLLVNDATCTATKYCDLPVRQTASEYSYVQTVQVSNQFRQVLFDPDAKRDD